jgi:signal transduction histidine kinase
LISITNIDQEIDYTEILAWEKVIHVLTHEIMNSMTPISSLSGLLRGKADWLSTEKPDFEKIRDIADGLEVIERRSQGLINFVNNYKVVTSVPKPKFSVVLIENLFKQIKLLVYEEVVNRGITIRFVLKANLLHATMDVHLIEQVLLNLIKNACDSCEARTGALIEVQADEKDKKIVISVQDNGAGIDAENLDKIFIPFFSTKKTGSGIGLSLSKQIMRLHRGSIHATSEPGKYTTFHLEFPK